MKPKPTPRTHQVLERVYQALGANRVHERWIDDDWGVEGLADSCGIITISPLPMVPAIIHEALHRAHPQWSERTIARVTTYTYSRMSDADCKRLYAAYAGKVIRMKSPTRAD